jgi:uncharacterized protein (DUF4415 family)
MKRKSASSAHGRQAAKKGASTRRGIDFSDIPEATEAQLKSMRRVGRPPLGETARQLIAIRIDPNVLAKLQKKAERAGIGYQTLINDLLKDYVDKSRAG